MGGRTNGGEARFPPNPPMLLQPPQCSCSPRNALAAPAMLLQPPQCSCSPRNALAAPQLPLWGKITDKLLLWKLFINIFATMWQLSGGFLFHTISQSLAIFYNEHGGKGGSALPPKCGDYLGNFYYIPIPGGKRASPLTPPCSCSPCSCSPCSCSPCNCRFGAKNTDELLME
jgi:hypothetical protein